MDPVTTAAPPASHSSDAIADAVLIDRIRSGDVQAYGVLVERYERSLLASVLPVVRGDLHAAQDIVQDVFVQCYLKLSGLRDGSRFAGWLLKSARRQAVRTARRLQQRPPYTEAAAQIRFSESSSPPAAIDFDEHQQLLTLVRQLPKHERLMVSLRYFDGHSVKQIAAMTQRPIGTVTKQLSRALSRLRDQLSPKTMISENQPCPPQTQTQNQIKQSPVL